MLGSETRPAGVWRVKRDSSGLCGHPGQSGQSIIVTIIYINTIHSISTCVHHHVGLKPDQLGSLSPDFIFIFNHQSSLLSTLSRLPPEVLTASLLFIIARLSALSSQRITSNSRKRSWPDNFTASRDLTVQSTLEEATLPPRMTYRRHPSSRKLARNREISELPRYLFQNFNAIFISVIKSVRQTGGHGCIF